MPAEKSVFDKFITALTLTTAIGLTVFQLLVASPLLLIPSTLQSGVHWAFVGTFFLLARPMRFRIGRLLDLFLIVITVTSSFALMQMSSSLVSVGGLYSQFQIAVSILQIIAGLIIGYRCMGRILPTLCILFVIYTLYGNKLPGVFRAARMSIMRLSTYLMVGNEGMFGMALTTSTRFIFMFVLFGSILSFIGAGEFFINLAFSVFGKIRGGPAQAAVYSCMLMGMVNGSGPAIVVTTGTFTIPLMRKTGFDVNTTGAIEAVAASGGQIMPPVMGSVAFLMSDMTSTAYSKIALAAFLPAVL
jgi:TRAP transporter 4TM/12TM fusion protein